MSEIPFRGSFLESKLTPARLQLTLFGNFALTVDDGILRVGPAISEMLAVLSVVGRLPRGRMQSLLWPECEPFLAAGRLRSLMYRLRQIPGIESAIVEPGTELELGSEIVVDFRIATGIAERLIRRLPVPSDEFADAIALLSADLLPFSTQEWLAQYQHGWSRTRLRALEAGARQAFENGDNETAITGCERVLLAEPFHERANCLMILALLREGYAQSARAAHRKLTELLSDELQRAPERTYRELVVAAGRVGGFDPH